MTNSTALVESPTSLWETRVREWEKSGKTAYAAADLFLAKNRDKNHLFPSKSSAICWKAEELDREKLLRAFCKSPLIGQEFIKPLRGVAHEATHNVLEVLARIDF